VLGLNVFTFLAPMTNFINMLTKYAHGRRHRTTPRIRTWIYTQIRKMEC